MIDTNITQELLGSYSCSYIDNSPFDEKFVRQIEKETFYNEYNKNLFTFDQLAAQIRKYGSFGNTILNDKHMKACFALADAFDLKLQKELARDCYFKTTDNKVQLVHMLTVAFIICPHQNENSQCEELWLLCNPELNDIIISAQITPFITRLSEIAVDCALLRLQQNLQEQIKNDYMISQTHSSLRYLERVKTRKQVFIEQIIRSLPAQINYQQFESLFIGDLRKVFFETSSLRLAISMTKPSQNGKQLANSFALITILEFLSDKEKIAAQLVCKKWQSQFVPMTLKTCSAQFTLKPTQYYQFVYEHPENGQRYYMGQKLDLQRDMREGKDFPSKFLSAGFSENYKQFRWRYDGEGRIEQNDGQGLIRRLAAHRTWTSDVYKQTGTRAITTTFKGHENFWQLLRVGQLKEMTYLLICNSNCCCKDGLDHKGFMLSLIIDAELQRTPESVYLVLKKFDINKKESQLPLWRLIPTN